MLDAAPLGLLRVNRDADTNKLNDLLTFMSNAILKSGKDMLTFKIQGYQGYINLQNSRILRIY